MVKCKRCGHDDFTHRRGEGQCEAVFIKKQSEFYKVEFAQDIYGWTQDIEYGQPCPCKVMMTWRPHYYKREPSPAGNLDDFF